MLRRRSPDFAVSNPAATLGDSAVRLFSGGRTAYACSVAKHERSKEDERGADDHDADRDHQGERRGHRLVRVNGRQGDLVRNHSRKLPEAQAEKSGERADQNGEDRSTGRAPAIEAKCHQDSHDADGE